MAFGGATVAQLNQMVELMNPGRSVDMMILIGETHWKAYDGVYERMDHLEKWERGRGHFNGKNAGFRNAVPN